MADNITYVAASLLAALMAMVQRFGVAPIPVLQGTAVSAAAVSATNAVNHTYKTARKADDRVPPRGRRL